MDHARYCQLIASEAARVSDVLATADLAAPVPTTPRWNIARLVKHLGSVHRWAEQIVHERLRERLDFRAPDYQYPAADDGLPQWFKAGAEGVAATLAATDPNTPVWAWGVDQHVRFWGRRLAHETAMHRADLELATGVEPRFPLEQAVDGIDEFLENLARASSFAPRVAELRGRDATLHLHATDGDGEWLISVAGDGFRWEHGHAKGDVAVRAAAADLLLLLYGRRKPAGGEPFQVFGDEAVLRWWLERAAI